MVTIDQAIAAYIIFRDKRDIKRKEQAAELAPYNEKLEKLENWLLYMLNKQGVESTRTDHGTAYKSVCTSTKIIDWDTTLDFIKANGLYHLLERRVSKKAVEEFIEAQGKPPEGVDIVREVRVNVRR